MSELIDVTADRLDGDARRLRYSTPEKRARFRHVVSVNGEEEDFDNINIHDFMTFEQEQLIDQEFIGKLKRKSASVDGNIQGTFKGLNRGGDRGMSTFRGAVRAIQTSEAILQALKHYSHRSDTETEEEEDSCETPWFHKKTRLQIPSTKSRDLLKLGKQSLEEQGISEEKPSESGVALNSTSSPVFMETTLASDELMDCSVRESSGVEVPEVQLVDAEADSCRDATETHVDVVTVSLSDVAIVSETTAVDASESRPLMTEADLSEPRPIDAGTSADVTNNTIKPTDGLPATTTTPDEPTETTDPGCQCCSVQ